MWCPPQVGQPAGVSKASFGARRNARLGLRRKRPKTTENGRKRPKTAENGRKRPTALRRKRPADRPKGHHMPTPA
eukprot:393340-Lingulodinium_polyedra.AAC.1